MKKITKDQVIQELKELGIQYENLEVKGDYIELIHSNGHTRLLTLDFSRLTYFLKIQSWSVENNYVQVIHCCGDIKLFTPDFSSETPWLKLRSWSIKDGYIECVNCDGEIKLFTLDLSSESQWLNLRSWSVKDGLLELIYSVGNMALSTLGFCHSISWRGMQSWSIKDGYVEFIDHDGNTRLFTLDFRHSTSLRKLQSWSIKDGYVELIDSYGRTKLTTLDFSISTNWLRIQSWSIRDDHIELICENEIYLFSLDLTSRIEYSSINNCEVCKFPELKEKERIFSHYSWDCFSSTRDLERYITESDKGDVLIISESLNSFIAEVLYFENECTGFTHIDELANQDFMNFEIYDSYIIPLKPMNKIYQKNNKFYFGLETISGFKVFIKINNEGEIKI